MRAKPERGAGEQGGGVRQAARESNKFLNVIIKNYHDFKCVMYNLFMQGNNESFDEIVIDLIDRDGRHIKCTKSQWIFHVCDEYGDHAYMEEYLEDVIYTLKNADRNNKEIFIDRNDPLKLIYQKKHLTDNCYVRVVNKFRHM